MRIPHQQGYQKCCKAVDTRACVPASPCRKQAALRACRGGLRATNSRGAGCCYARNSMDGRGVCSMRYSGVLGNAVCALLAGLLVALPACAADDREPVALHLRVDEGILRAVITNRSDDPIWLRGGLGSPPMPGALQWHVFVAGKATHECALVEPGLGFRLLRKQAREIRMPAAAIERIYCLSSGIYEVQLSMMAGDSTIHSNIVRVKAPPKRAFQAHIPGTAPYTR